MALSTTTLPDGSVQTTCTSDSTGALQWVSVAPPVGSAGAIEAANLTTLTNQGVTALSNNSNYLGIASPTTAQAVAQVQALTRQVDGVIRLLLSQLDATT